MKRGLILINLMFLIFSFTGCDKDQDNVTSTKLLTISVDASFNTSKTENWVIIHDENGALIDFKSFESNEEFVLETMKSVPGNTIGVTLLKYLADGNNQFYNLDSYLNIEKGKKLRLRTNTSSSTSAGSVTGTFNVSVNGYNSMDQFSMTNKFSNMCNLSGSNLLNLNCSVFNNSSKYLLQLSDNSGILKYKIMDNVKPNDSYTISFSEMSEFDKTVEFSFAQSANVFLMVMGRESDQTSLDNSYLLNYHFGSDSHTKIRAGYLNSLSKYYTYLNIGYPEFQYVYVNKGSIPDANFMWPSKSDFNLSSKLINNFSSNNAKPYIRRSSSWMYQSPSNSPMRRIYWNVSSESDDHSFAELPSEIVIKHPLLAFDNLKHSSTTFYTQSKTYSAFISEIFEEENNPLGTVIGISIW